MPLQDQTSPSSGSQQQDVEVILTFDDGPHHAREGNRTRRVLDKLKNNIPFPNIRAVFFIQSHALDDQKKPFRGKNVNGTAVLKEALMAGHLVEVHTGFEYEGAHNFTHIERLTEPEGKDFKGGLPQDLEQCKAFINSLDDDLEGVSHTTQFVRPVEGKRNPKVRARYTDAGLSMVLWDIDSRDTHGYTPEQINNHLGTEIKKFLDARTYQIVILFHELKKQVYDKDNLDSYINTIKTTITNYRDPRAPNKTFNPVLNPSKDRIREIFKAKWQN